MITLSTDWVQVLGLVIGILLPLLVGIVTKTSTNPAIKATLLAGLSLVTNILTGIEHALASHTEFNLGNALVLGLGTFIVAVASHLGFWSPTRVTAFLQARLGRKDKPIIAIDDYEGKHVA